MKVRQYISHDYPQMELLYKKSELFGGQFDANRDSREKLQKRIEADPDAILVAENNGRIVGTISLIEDGRVAWLFRFCVEDIANKDRVAKMLFDKASEILKHKEHRQVLVYSPVGNTKLDKRYENLGFTKGNDYTCFWKDLE